MALTVSFVLSPATYFLLSPSSADYRFTEARQGSQNLHWLDIRANGKWKADEEVVTSAVSAIIEPHLLERSSANFMPAVPRSRRRA